MKQTTFASMTYSAKRGRTRREAFLAEMEQVVPWAQLLGVIEPHYPASGRRGRHRWVVERTLSLPHRFRRLRIRFERRADIHQAFLTLGCCMISMRFIQRFC